LRYAQDYAAADIDCRCVRGKSQRASGYDIAHGGYCELTSMFHDFFQSFIQNVVQS
jgi:hypothetical protein